MSFKDIQNIQLSYYTLSDDVAQKFYIPCLSEARVYKRQVGYFSSSILLDISKGLGAFADNGGKMKLLVSPRLEEKDYEAIKKGYDAKKYLEEKIINNFDFNVDYFQKEDRFGMLSYLIENGILDIKIVFLEKNNESSLFHLKEGFMEDECGNSIAFNGSANETFNALNNNYDSIDVFCSWTSDESDTRCSMKEMAFDRIWDGFQKNLITIPFPEAIRKKLLTYKTEYNGNFTEIDKIFIRKLNTKPNEIKYPYIPDNIELFDYQNEAIEEWASNGYKGIFDMATGTGKTFTGIGAICKLFNDKKRIIAIICAPYKHLVDQWCDELKLFNIEPIKCYGGLNYEIKLERAYKKFNQKRSNFFCCVICNGSFTKNNLQTLFNSELEDTLLIVDEAHNFGADGLSKTLTSNYRYRLALSATLDRYGDKEGTEKLYNFFGKKCITYTLERAIEENKLTPYKYYPIVTSLTEDEYEKYVELSNKIAKYMHGDDEIPEKAKLLLLARARLVAGAKNKLVMLKNIMTDYVGQKNMLVYCGAVKYGEIGYDDALEEKRQIELVLNILNNELNIYSSKFTSEENMEIRKLIIDAFKNENIDALVAIKCLDEGMNIPAIKTAFILASSTNPKEYIQRRGRVLRKSKNKDFAEIYDFITLPFDLNEDTQSYTENLTIEKNLARKELNRVIDFANLSINPSYSNKIIDSIKKQYKMDINMEDEENYG